MKINCTKIYKSYHDVEIFKAYNLQIQANERVFLTGKKGKTTLLNCISGQEPIDQGQLTIDGLSTYENHDYLMTHGVAYVQQKPIFVEELTVEQTFQLRCEWVQKEWDQEWVEKVCQTLHIQDLYHQYPSQCTLEQQQLIACACALIQKPSLLLLDEPTRNLSEASTIALMQFLYVLKNIYPCTIVMSTEDRKLFAYAQRVIDVTENNEPVVEIKEVSPKTMKNSNRPILSILRSFYHYHRFYIILYLLGMSAIIGLLSLSFQIGPSFNQIMIELAGKTAYSKRIEFPSHPYVSKELYKQIEKIDGVDEIEGFHTHLFGYERDEKHPFVFTVCNQTISDHDFKHEEAINFDFNPQGELLAGRNDPKGTELVLSKQILDQMELTVDDVMNQQIVYELPYVKGIDNRTIIYDNEYFFSKKTKNVFDSIKLEGTVIGVVNDENKMASIYCDYEDILQIVQAEIKKNPLPDSLTSPLDIEIHSLMVNTIEDLLPVLDELQNLGFETSTTVDDILHVIHRSRDIEILLLIGSIILAGYSLSRMIGKMNRKKFTFIQILQQDIFSQKQRQRVIVLDWFMMMGCLSVMTFIVLSGCQPIFEALLSLSLPKNENILWSLSFLEIVGVILSVLVTSGASLHLYCKKKEVHDSNNRKHVIVLTVLMIFLMMLTVQNENKANQVIEQYGLNNNEMIVYFPTPLHNQEMKELFSPLGGRVHLDMNQWVQKETSIIIQEKKMLCEIQSFNDEENQPLISISSALAQQFNLKEKDEVHLEFKGYRKLKKRKLYLISSQIEEYEAISESMSFTWKIKDIFESQNNRIAFNQNAIEMIQQQSNFNEQIKYTEAKVQFNDHQDFQKAIKTLEESAFVVDETKESIKQLKKEHKLIHVPSHLLMVVNGVLLLILISKKKKLMYK